MWAHGWLSRQAREPAAFEEHGSCCPLSEKGPDRVKTLTPGRQFMNFSRFSAFSTITGPAERKNSLQMRRFQTISEFSHGLGQKEPFPEKAAARRTRAPSHR
jgi:hypothetical protein